MLTPKQNIRFGLFPQKLSIFFRALKLSLILIVSLSASGCITTVVGAVVDTTIAVVKVPFKVAGAVIDAVTPGDSDDLVDGASDGDESIDVDSDEAAIDMESKPF